MAINTSSDNPVYLAYHDAGPKFALIGPALVWWILGNFGAFLNLFVVFTTCLTRSLRGTANYLMALICLAEAIHQIGHSVFFGVVVSGVNFIDLQLAAWLTLPQHFCMCLNLMTMFLVALDRLMAISIEKFHSNVCLKYKMAYLSFLTFIGSLYGAICSYFVIWNAQKNRGMPTTGCIAEILPVSGEIQMLWFLLLNVPLMLAAICYLIIGAIFQFNKSVSAKTNMRLLRSLFIILCVSIGGYVVNFSIYEVLLSVDFGLGFVSIWQLSFIAGALLNICAAANAPILYVNSTEYRKAFKQFWARISIGKYLHSSTGAAVHPNPLQNIPQTSNSIHHQNQSRPSILNASSQYFSISEQNLRRYSQIQSIH